MRRIIKIGMDVHSTNYTLCALECVFGEDDRLLGEIHVGPDYKQIIVFIENLKHAAFLGLTPGEQSSGDHINRTGISRAGNSQLRRLIVEAANGICKGSIGYKSKDLKARQAGNPPEVIAYADKANERLRRKYYKLFYKGKPKNVSKTATARELACFIRGMMTDNIGEGTAA